MPHTLTFCEMLHLLQSSQSVKEQEVKKTEEDNKYVVFGDGFMG
jgi:hypothetical protein